MASTLTALQVAQLVNAPSAAAVADLSTGSVSTLAGTGANVTAAGSSTTASFATPQAVAYSGGNAYVADSDAVAKVVTSSGATTVVTTALTGVQSLATDGTNLYSLRSNNHNVSSTVISTGVTTALTTLPGGAAQSVTLAADGYLYVDASNVVYKQSPSTGVYTTVATFPTTETLYGIATDGAGAVFVIGNDAGSGLTRIAKVVISSGTISTLAADGKLPSANVSSLYYQGGYLYVGGQNFYTVRRYATSTGAASITAGAGNPAHADGIGAKAWFTSVNGVTGDGTNLFVADSNNGTGNYVRKIAPGTALTDALPATVASAITVDYGSVTTLAGSGVQGSASGTATTAQFNYPYGLTYLNGSLYVADQSVISKVNPLTGATTIVAGPGGGCPTGSLLGTSSALSPAFAMTTDGTFVYAAESGCGSAIIRFDPVTTSVSNLGGMADGGTQDLTLGPDKALYGTSGANIDRMNLLDGTSTRWLTLPISGSGTLTGIASDATYLYVLGSVDVSGTTEQQIYKINISTHAYTVGAPSTLYHQGQMTLAGPRLYLPGTGDSLVSVNPVTGVASGVAGGFGGYADLTGGGTGGARFFGIQGIVSDGTSVYVADSANMRIRKVRTMDPGIPVGETYGDSLLDTSSGTGADDSGNLTSSLSGMQPLDVGRADPVNTATGAFTRQETDLTFPGAGTTLNFTRTYTSVNPATGRLGTGWTDPYQSSLSFDGPGNATYVAEDGATVLYPKSGSTYTGPQGAPTLAAISGGYTLTTYDQRVTTFNAAGQLTKTVDAHGKGLTFGYTGAQQTSITDNAGRVVTLGYTGALLTSLTLPDGRHVNYGYTGIVLTSVRNLGGHTTGLNYDSGGYLSTETDPMTNTVFTNTYDDATGRVTSQINATGQTTTFGWIATGTDPGTGTATTTAPDSGVTTDVYNKYVLVQSTDPAGGITKNSYNALGNLVEVDDPLGRVMTMTYDATGNLLSKTLNATLTTSWTYNAINEPLTTKDPLGHTTTWTYNTAGDKLTQADAMSPPAVTSWTYNPDGTVATMVDPRGNVSGGTPSAFTTSYGYDAAANQTSVTSPLGEKTAYGFDADGRLTSIVDPRGFVNPNTPSQFTTSTTYFPNNQPDVVTDPLGHVITDAYNADDELSSSTNDAGKVTSYTYDAGGDRITVTDSLLHTTTTTYDYAGRPLSVTDADGNMTTTTYDTRGNKATVTDPRGNVAGTTPAVAATFTTTYGYDADNELVTRSHPLSSTVTATTTTAYDSYGRITKVTDPNGHYTQTGYDNGGNVLTTTDANNNVTRYTSYDNDNRLLSTSDPLTHITSYGYDVDGHLLTRTDPNLRITTNTYDSDNRPHTSVSPDSPALTTTTGYDAASHVTSTTYSDGATPNVSYLYDPVGRRTSMTDGTGTSTTVYDDLGRTTSVTDGAGHTVGYGYDDANRMNTLTYPGTSRTVTYGYTNAGRMHTVTDWLSHTTTISQDPAGNYVSLSYPNSVTDARTYDMSARLTGITDTKPGPSTVATFSYAYDKTDQLLTDNTAISGQSADNRNYTYYNGDQIKSTPNGNYTVDASEELTGAPSSSGTAPTIHYDAAGQLTTTAAGSVTTTYGYNARGDRVTATPNSGSAITLSYSQADNLTGFTKGTTTASYTYNGDSLRMSATASGTTHTYTWNTAGSSLPMLLDDGTSAFVYGPTGPLEQINDLTSSVSYLLGDHQGSTRLLADSTGALTGTYSYDAFGNSTHTGTGATPLTYTGEYSDPSSGYLYLRARDYDPSSAQFLTVDPQLATTHDAYGYTANDPINNEDPTGASCISGFGWACKAASSTADFATKHWRGIATVLVTAGCVVSAAVACAIAGVVLAGATNFDDQGHFNTKGFIVDSAFSVVGGAAGAKITGSWTESAIIKTLGRHAKGVAEHALGGVFNGPKTILNSARNAVLAGTTQAASVAVHSVIDNKPGSGQDSVPVRNGRNRAM